MADRAMTPEFGNELRASVAKPDRCCATLGYGSFAPGNADGGLSTIKEKSVGAYAKSGSAPISGPINPGDVPPKGGIYLMDVVPDGEVRFGFPKILDNSEIVEMIASGCHLTLFVTGRGSAIAPAIKICANPETYRPLAGDMHVDVGRILEGRAKLWDVGDEFYSLILSVADGNVTKSEQFVNREVILIYKAFEPIGPACLPSSVTDRTCPPSSPVN